MIGAVPIDSSQKKILVIESLRKEIIRWLFVFLLVAGTFLFLRFFLKLIGANPDSFFAAFVYLISGIFMLPFFGIIPNELPPAAGQMDFDGTALLAIFCYIILVLMGVAVVHLGAKIFKIGKQKEGSVQKKEIFDTSVIDENVE